MVTGTLFRKKIIRSHAWMPAVRIYCICDFRLLLRRMFLLLANPQLQINTIVQQLRCWCPTGWLELGSSTRLRTGSVFGEYMEPLAMLIGSGGGRRTTARMDAADPAAADFVCELIQSQGPPLSRLYGSWPDGARGSCASGYTSCQSFAPVSLASGRGACCCVSAVVRLCLLHLALLLHAWVHFGCVHPPIHGHV